MAINVEGNFFDKEIFGYELRKAQLLTKFAKLCAKIKKDDGFRRRVKDLYLGSFDQKKTLCSIYRNECHVDLNEEETQLIYRCFDAFLKKNDYRKRFSDDFRERLIFQQDGQCAICKCLISNEFVNKVHVDHIIPWQLVGDELDDNYQALCPKCNREKHSSLDYLLRVRLGLR